MHVTFRSLAMRAAVLVVAAATTLSLWAVPEVAASAAPHAGKSKPAVGRRGGSVTAADYAKRAVTSSSRIHAAHDRASALQVQAAAAKRKKGAVAVAGLAPAAAARTAAVAAAPALTPGGEPDYFGNTPNYATSPLPTGGATVTITDPTGVGATASALVTNGVVTGVTVAGGGSGYSASPTIAFGGGGSGATAHATVVQGVTSVTIPAGGAGYDANNPPAVLFTGPTTGTDVATGTVIIDSQGAVTDVTITNAGSGYTAPPTITFDNTDPAGGPAKPGSGASATANISGLIGSVTVDTGGAGYVLDGSGIRKFVDTLPGVGSANKNDLGQFISVAHPDTKTFPGADYYEIGLVETQKQLHKDLPATTLRLYVQLNKGTDADGVNTVAPDVPQYMGPMIDAQAGRPVRVKFVNMLPTSQGASCDRTGLPAQNGTINGSAYNDTAGCGDLFLPVDTNVMGAGMGPLGMNTGTKPTDYAQNRATIHLHGGKTPWISDGTPHQWITPTGESTAYPKGVSVSYVPDMWFDGSGNASATQDSAHTSNNPGDGSETFYYTNQQSARMMFFHDHSYGITRLNVYAGEEAPYIIHDAAEKAFESATADIQDGADTIPLVLQDKTFVPNDSQLAAQDPTWQKSKWGGQGNLWMPHVYMTNQNPTNDNGANPMGRWDYGPWFWPPYTGLKNPTVANPLFDPSCDPATNACENSQNPGWDKPNEDGTDGNVSQTMETFFDTMLVNGTPYPTQKVGQKVYRLRILNGSNDRHLSLSLFYAKSNADMWKTDPATGKLVLNDANAGELPMMDATQTAIADPANGCTAAQKATWPHDGRDGGVPVCKAAGPDMVQVGNDGGFLPAPATISAQPLDYEYNRRNIIVLDVLHHGLMLAPAERADVLVDFSKVPDGAKLVLYNDAPAADPAIDPRNDYYTGDPDQTTSGGAPTTQPGYGPNTRTVLQFQVESSLGTSTGTTTATVAAALKTAYEADQPAPIVPQTAYNGLTLPQGYNWTLDPSGNGVTTPTAVGTTTVSTTSNNYTSLTDTTKTFTPVGATSTVTIGMQPKAIVEEFDQTWGRMNATLGAEMPNTNANVQTTVPFGYAEPATEVLDPHQVGTPIGTLGDGTQIWKVTHNGVDSHPVHFHLFDVQLINRVGWDGAKYAPEAGEVGWKDTVLMHPLEDTIVALRPQIPVLPFKLPNSVRPIDPAMPIGSPISTFDPTTGQALTVPNTVQDYGWEYVWHCHMLSHEEMDFMRPIIVHVAPPTPTGLTTSPGGLQATKVGLTWTQPGSGNPIVSNWTLQRATDAAFTAGLQTTNVTPASAAFVDTSVTNSTTYFYRLRSESTAGYSAWTGALKVKTAAFDTPATPTGLKATYAVVRGQRTVTLSWTNAAAYTKVTVQRATNVAFTNAQTTTVAPVRGVLPSTWADTSVTAGATYYYRVAGTLNISSAYSTPVGITATVGAPAPPMAVAAAPRLTAGTATRTTVPVTLTPATPATVPTDSYQVQISRTAGFIGATSKLVTAGPGATNYTVPGLQRGTGYYLRAAAVNKAGTSAWSTVVQVRTAP